MLTGSSPLRMKHSFSIAITSQWTENTHAALLLMLNMPIDSSSQAQLRACACVGRSRARDVTYRCTTTHERTSGFFPFAASQPLKRFVCSMCACASPVFTDDGPDLVPKTGQFGNRVSCQSHERPISVIRLFYLI